MAGKLNINTRMYSSHQQRTQITIRQNQAQTTAVHTTNARQPPMVHTTHQWPPQVVHTTHQWPPQEVHTTNPRQPPMVHTTHQQKQPAVYSTPQRKSPVVYTTTCTFRSGELKHSGHQYKDGPLGENIAGKTSSNMAAEYTGSECVDQWYSEIKDYDFRSHNTGLKTGHFSQVVWKDSKELGVGMAAKDGKCIVVANYHPAGNYKGMYKDNVSPAEGKSAGSKVKSLFGGLSKKADDSSSSSDEEKTPGGASRSPRTTTTSTGKTKVTITKTITKPDGTVETITEERVEDSKSPNVNNNVMKQVPASSGAVKVKPKQSTSEFRKDALDTHNKLRAKHRAGKLKLNSELCTIAQKWAEHLSTISTLQHSSGNHKGQPLGENIASKWGSNGADYTGEEAVQQWYSEESAYDYSGKSNAGASGHFTQVVWKGSEELGIGKAADSKGRVYVVANYSPAGNYIGNFAANVSRP